VYIYLIIFGYAKKGYRFFGSLFYYIPFLSILRVINFFY